MGKKKSNRKLAKIRKNVARLNAQREQATTRAVEQLTPHFTKLAKGATLGGGLAVCHVIDLLIQICKPEELVPSLGQLVREMGDLRDKCCVDPDIDHHYRVTYDAILQPLRDLMAHYERTPTRQDPTPAPLPPFEEDPASAVDPVAAALAQNDKASNEVAGGVPAQG